MKKINFVFMCLLLANFVSFAQEPDLIKKNINDNLLLDGTKLPTESGWQLKIGDQQEAGEVSVTPAGEIHIKTGEGQAYTVHASRATETAFNPTTDYTIEFRLKVPKNNGRGFDLAIRDGKNFSKLLCVTHNRVLLNGVKEPLLTLNGKDYHAYRVAVERDKAKAHLYVDGSYKNSYDLEAKANSPFLLFGKGNTKADTEIVLDYLTFDLTGAYAPKQ